MSEGAIAGLLLLASATFALGAGLNVQNKRYVSAAYLAWVSAIEGALGIIIAIMAGGLR